MSESTEDYSHSTISLLIEGYPTYISAVVWTMLVRTLIIALGSLLIFNRSIENELPQGFTIILVIVVLLYMLCELLDFRRKTKQAKKIMDSGKEELLENLSKRLSQ